jgi:hypothetical protein
MANWEESAISGLIEVQSLTNASNTQMDQLRAEIDSWANVTPDGRQWFPFGQLRNHGVSALTGGGSVLHVAYGDRC